MPFTDCPCGRKMKRKDKVGVSGTSTLWSCECNRAIIIPDNCGNNGSSGSEQLKMTDKKEEQKI